MKPVYTLYIYNDAYNITFIQLHLRVNPRNIERLYKFT